jgi:lipopolysaccharide assembly protein B
MEIDVTWFLLGLPLAFVFGWLASRLDLRQLRIDNKRSPKAYFKGLNHLLNEQQDEAIDAFIEAVQKDPDTSELHFALGNLFRRRGEYDRAVRVHEHLLARGDLPQPERERAQHALALDFLQAGLLDRAEDALGKLDGSKYESQARLARLAIYERTRDWPAAEKIAQQLQSSGQGDFSVRAAHYLCEQATTLNPDQQRALLLKAMDLAPQSGRARIALAELEERCGNPNEALNGLLAGIESAPTATILIANKIAELAAQTQRVAQVLPILQSLYDSTHSLDVLQALAKLRESEGGKNALREQQLQHLKREPSLVIAAQLLKSQGIDPSLCCATAAPPAVLKPAVISGNARVAKVGTVTLLVALKSYDHYPQSTLPSPRPRRWRCHVGSLLAWRCGSHQPGSSSAGRPC